MPVYTIYIYILHIQQITNLEDCNCAYCSILYTVQVPGCIYKCDCGYRQIYVNWAATLRNFTPRQLGTWQNKGHSRTQLELVIGPMNLFLKIQIFKRPTITAKSQFFASGDVDRGSYRIWIWISTTFFSEILWSYHFITTLGLSLAPLVISISVQLNNDF